MGRDVLLSPELKQQRIHEGGAEPLGGAVLLNRSGSAH